jgi:hypothetical protein
MAKPNNDVAVSAPSTPEQTVTLKEFCMRLSETVTRPELIGGFEATERAAGKQRDTEAAYRARYAAFINKPL